MRSSPRPHRAAAGSLICRAALGLALLISAASAGSAQTASPEPRAPALRSVDGPAPGAPSAGSAPATPGDTLPAAQSGAPSRSAATLVLPHNLSPWGMFMSADAVVKAVMIGLALASVVTWTIWLAKTLELVAAKRAGRRLIGQFAAARSLREAAASAGQSRSAVAELARAAVDEAELSNGLDKDGLKERVASLLERIEAGATRKMTRGTGLLATIGSTAPFVGLFGTVWGIMNAFIGISKSQTTNLAVVAPGIAEALLATAIGLVAAIPAVVIYNSFARSTSGYRVLLADAAAQIMRHLSRDLDRGRRPHLQAAE